MKPTRSTRITARTPALSVRAKYSLQPERFRLRYSLIARRMHHVLESGDERGVELKQIVKEADAIITDARSVSQKPPRGSGRDLSSRVKEFLDNQIVSTTAVLREGAVLEVDHLGGKTRPNTDQLAKRLSRALRDTSTTYRSLYNEACFWSCASAHYKSVRPDDPQVAKALDLSMGHLRRCLSTAPPAEAAILAAKAPGDPSLRAVLSDEAREPVLRRLLSLYAAEPAGTEVALAGLDAIGDAAAIFKRAGLETVDDVVEEMTLEVLQAILEFDGEAAADWLDAVHLVHAGVPTVADVNHLRAVDITSPGALAAADAVALQKRLQQTDADTAPTVEALDHWIASAKRWRPGPAAPADESADATHARVLRNQASLRERAPRLKFRPGSSDTGTEP